jgi:hypothetical protein
LLLERKKERKRLDTIDCDHSSLLGFGAFGASSGFPLGQSYGSAPGGGPMRRGDGGGRGGGGPSYMRGGGRGGGGAGGFRGRN